MKNKNNIIAAEQFMYLAETPEHAAFWEDYVRGARREKITGEISRGYALGLAGYPVHEALRELLTPGDVTDG